MLRKTFIAHRRGQPNPPKGDKFWRVPLAHRPFQGGQQHFQSILLQRANEVAAKEQKSSTTTMINSSSSSANKIDTTPSSSGSSSSYSYDPKIQFPEQNVLFRNAKRSSGSQYFGRKSVSAEEDDDGLIADLKQGDQFTTRRSFNERDFYDRVQVEMKNQIISQRNVGQEEQQKRLQDALEQKQQEVAANTPRTVIDDTEFHEAHGYSILKKKSKNYRSEFPEGNPMYANLDLWSEMPMYPAGTYFLYLIARRRNAYAVIYDHEGKRLLPTYSVGNRGLKESDRGFKAEGSAENAHQVTSSYLSDVLPKIKEIEQNAGRPVEKGRKIDLVVRVLGFYNGRQGAIRAVTDHSDVYQVKYLEDVTPFPLNGPRMPRAVVKASTSTK